MRRWVAAVAISASLGLGGCTNTAVFVCVSSDDCNSQPGGLCEDSGYCSFPDAECQTGQRYGGAAGDGLAQRCVPPDEDATSTDTTTTTTTTSATVSTFSTSTPPPPTSSTTQAATSSTTGTTSGETTDPTAGQSTGTTSEESSDSSDSSDSSSETTSEPSACQDALFDSFEGAGFGPQWAVSGDNLSVESGDARIDISAADGDDYGYVTSVANFPGDLLELTVDVSQAPAEPNSQLVFGFETVPSSQSVDFLINGDYLTAREWVAVDDFTDHAEALFDPVEHRFLRIRETDGQVEFEFSADNTTFATFYTLDLDTSGWTAQVYLGGGNWAVNPEADFATVASLRICALP